MGEKARTAKGTEVLADFLELGANAFAGGVMVAIALAVITLALATSAQAAPMEQAACMVESPTEPGSEALTPAVEDAARVGALWANLLMATLGLSAAGIVAVIGRSVPARKDASASERMVRQ